jgi:hypothetical protein
MPDETREIVYVAHPLRPDPTRLTGPARVACRRNIQNTTGICEQLLKEHSELLILSPIHAFSFINPLCYGETAELVLEQCRRLLELADELWVYGEYKNSEGCQMEIAHATALGKPVVYKKREQ